MCFSSVLSGFSLSEGSQEGFAFGSILRGVFEVSWRRLGRGLGVLVASWRRLGGVLGRLGASWASLSGVLEAPWRVLGVSWRLLGGLGRILGAS